MSQQQKCNLHTQRDSHKSGKDDDVWWWYTEQYEMGCFSVKLNYRTTGTKTSFIKTV